MAKIQGDDMPDTLETLIDISDRYTARSLDYANMDALIAV